MSTEVDKRVVQMQFDNKDFEQNISETMKTLEKFESKLDFTKAAKEFDQLERAADKVTLSGLTDAAEAVSVKFDAMQFLAIKALNNIVDSAASAGKKLIMSMSMDQITAGFDKYESKLQSTQVIMNATGKSVDEVGERLERLMAFTDETSYSFTDMVNNISKFTSSNIDLDVAVTSMMGIANAAGLAGASVNDATHAMDGFSKAIAQGYMTRQNWQWIRTAHMDTAEFKKQLIEAAVQAGTLIETSEGIYKTFEGNAVSIADFETALKDSWLTTEVMNKTLNRFGNTANSIIDLMDTLGYSAKDVMDKVGDPVVTIQKKITDEGKTMSQAISEYEKEAGDGLRTIKSIAQSSGLSLEETLTDLSTKFDDLGLKAFRASQQARTFTDALNATKDAVSSGWMKTFELIFGNYDEAVELWSSLTDELYDIFAAGAESRNEIFSWWKEQGGRDILFGLDGEIGIVSTAWENLKNILGAVKAAWEAVFPPITKERLLAMTVAIRDFVVGLKLSEESCKTLSAVIQLLLSPLAALLYIAKGIGVVFIQLAVLIFGVVDAFLAAIATGNPFQDLLESIFGSDGYTKMAEAFETILEKIGTVFSTIGKSFEKYFGDISILDAITGAFKRLGDAIAPIGEFISKGIVNGIVAISEIDLSWITESLEKIVNGIFEVFSNLISGKENPIEMFFTKILGSDRYAAIADSFSKILEKIKTAFLDIGTGIRDFFAGSNIFEKILGIFSKLGEILSPIAGWMMDKLVEGVQAVANIDFSNIIQFLKDFGNGFKDMINNIGEVFTPVVENVKLFSGTLKNASTASAKNVVAALTKNFKGLNNIVERIKETLHFDEIVNTLSNSFGKLKDALGVVGDVFVGLIEKVTPAKILLFSFGAGLVGLLFSLNTAVTNFGKVGTSLVGVFDAMKKRIQPNQYKDVISLIVTLTAAILALSLIPVDKLWNIVGAMGAIAGAIVLLSTAMGLISKFLVDAKTTITLKKMAESLLMLSAGIAAVAVALTLMTYANMDQMIPALGALAAVIIGVSTAAILISKFQKGLVSGGVGLVAFALAINLIVNSLNKIAAADLTGVQNNIAGLLGVIAIVGALAVAASGIKFSSGVGLIAFAAGLMVFLGTLKLIGKYDASELLNNIEGLLAIMTVIITLSIVSRIAGNNMLKAGAGLLAMAAALSTLGFVVKQLGALDKEAVIKGTAAVSALLVAVGVMQALGSLNRKTAKAIAEANKSFVAIAAGILILSLAIKYLGNMETDELLQGTAVVAGLMTLFTLLTKISQVAEKTNMSIAVIVVTIGTLTAAIALLTLIPFEEAMGAVAALSVLFLAVAAFTSSLQHIKFGAALANVVAMAGLIAGVTGALIVLNMFDIKTSLETMLGMSAIIAALGVAVRLMSSYKSNLSQALSAIVLMGGMLAECLVAMYVLTLIPDTSNLMTKVAALILLLAGVGIVGGVVGSMAPLMTELPAAVGSLVLGMGALIGGVTLIAGSLGGLASNEDVKNAIQNGIEVMGFIGQAIGAFVGGIIGGFVGGAMKSTTDAMPAVAQNLTDFANGMVGFFNVVNDIKDDAPAKIESLASMIDTIISSVRRGTGIKTEDFSQFTSDLNSMAPNLVNFCEEFSSANISQDALDNAALACSAISQIVDVVPKKGALDVITGSKDLANFASDLASLGTAMVDFMESIASGNFDDDQVKRAVNVARIVNGFVMELQSTGGMLQSFTGTKDLVGFAKSLTGENGFAQNMVKFSQEISDGNFDDDQVKRAVNVARIVNGFTKELDKSGGMLQSFTGTKDLKAFAAGLIGEDGFATNMIEFSELMSAVNIDDSIVTKTNTLGDVIRSITNAIPKTGGIGDIFNGSWNIAGLGEQIAKFGQGVATYNNEVSGFGTDLVGMLESAIALKGDTIRTAGSNLTQGFVDGLNTNKTKADTSSKNLAESVVGKMRDKVGYSAETSAYKPYAGYLVDGFILGIDNKQSKLETRVKELGENSVLKKFKETLGINSPSKKFKEFGEYIIDGLVNGLDKDNKATKGIAGLANSIKDTFADILGIHSPSRVFYDNGVWIIEGLVQGIQSDASAEEIMEQKARAMVSAFTNVFDSFSLAAKINTNVYDIFEQLFGDITTEDELKANKTNKLSTALEDAISMLEQKGIYYKAMVDEFGKDSAAAAKAYSEAQQAFLDTIAAAKNFSDLQNEEYNKIELWDEEELARRRMLYMEQLMEGYDKGVIANPKLAEQIQNMTDEELEVYKKSIGKLDATREELVSHAAHGLDLSETQKNLLESLGLDEQMNQLLPSKTTVSDVLNKYMNEALGVTFTKDTNLQKQFDDYISSFATEARIEIEYAKEKGLKSSDSGDAAAAVGAYDGSQYSSAFEDMFNGKQFNLFGSGDNEEDAEEFGENTLLSLIKGLSNGITSWGNKIGDMFSGFGGSIIDSIKQVFGINSPSKVMYGIGEYLMMGLSNGIDSSSGDAVNSMTELDSLLIDCLDNHTMLDAGTSMGNSVVDGMISAIEDRKDEIADTLTTLASSTSTASRLAEKNPTVKASIRPTTTTASVGKLSVDPISVSRLSQSVESLATSVDQLKKIQNGSQDTKPESKTTTQPTVVFEQTINSPKAISQAEVYRQTKNLLSVQKGKVN